MTRSCMWILVTCEAAELSLGASCAQKAEAARQNTEPLSEEHRCDA